MQGAKGAQNAPGKHTETSVLKKIATSGAANMGAAIVGSVANFLLIVFVTRFWPLAEAGVFFAATSFFNIALALSHLGADQGIVRFIAWNNGRNEHLRNRTVVLSGVVPAIFMAVVVGSAGVVLSQTLALSLDGSGRIGSTAIIWVLVVSLPIAVLYEQFLAICRGFAIMRPTIVLERALRPVLQMILILLVGMTGQGLVALALAWAVPYAAGLLMAAIALLRVLKAHPEQWSKSEVRVKEVAPEFWKFTGPRGLARLAQVAIQRADVIIVTVLLGPAAAAIYTAATRFLVLGQVITSALQQVSEPQLAGLLSSNRHQAVATVVRQMTLWSVTLVWPIYIVLAVHAPTLMLWVFGPDYVGGAPALVVLCLAMLCSTAMGPMDVLLLMAGRSSLSLMNTSFALFLDIALCYLLIPHYGIFGAGLAWAVAILTKSILCAWQVHRHLKLNPPLRFLGVWLISLFFLFGVVGAGATLLPQQPWVAVSISVLTGLFYLAILWRKRSLLLPSGAQQRRLK
ncbi:lipopolysaccharide biosynthesis protein [Glutamicibacter ardleyensis]|uniref:lipopolysaccharide biosynthesis protein n=1 Tax=Glutamicibacter ardleyensis TaxID=225894 RepID=UPI003FD24334